MGEEEFVQQESGWRGEPWEKRARMWGFLELSYPFRSLTPVFVISTGVIVAYLDYIGRTDSSSGN